MWRIRYVCLFFFHVSITLKHTLSLMPERPSHRLSRLKPSSLLRLQIDGNSLGHGGICGNTVAPIVSTPILLQAVASNGYTLLGAPVTLLDNNGISDSGVTEAPSLVKAADGTYVLFYSRDCYSSINYTVSYATASSVNGPYTRRADLLVGGVAGEDGGAMNLTGTGGADVLWDGVHMGMLALSLFLSVS